MRAFIVNFFTHALLGGVLLYLIINLFYEIISRFSSVGPNGIEPGVPDLLVGLLLVSLVVLAVYAYIKAFAWINRQTWYQRLQ